MSNPGHHDETLLSVSAAARLLGVSASSLRVWAAEGKIAHRRTEGGHRRFLKGDLDRWLADRGAELPATPTRAPELLASRMEPLPDVAAGITDALADILDAASSADTPGTGPARRRRPRRRRSRLEGQVASFADGIAAGDLGRHLRDAEWNGYRHGASGSPGEGPLGEALALRWAIDAVLSPRIEERAPRELRSLQRALDRLVIRVAAGLAEGLGARRRSARA